MSRPIYLARVVAGSSVSQRLAPRRIAPLDAHLLLTENCQAKCITCDYWKTHKEDKLSAEVTVRTIDRLGQLGFKHLRLAGGEILLRRDLFEILQRADTRPFREIRIQTNGLLLSQRARAINDSPLTHVCVSLDATGETNDRLRGVKGYYERAVDGASKLEGKEIWLSCTLTEPGAEHLEALIDLAQANEWAFSYNLLNNAIGQFEHADLSCWLRSETLDKTLEVLDRRLNLPRFELDYIRKHYELGPSRGFDSGEPPCVLGYVQMYVTSNGDVLSGCYDLPPLGNILEDDLKDILNAERYGRRARAMLQRRCKGCVCNVSLSLKAKHPFATLADSLGIRWRPPA